MEGILGEVDGFLYYFPHRLFTIIQWKSGGIPLWNPYYFCGYPQLAAMQTAVLYPPHIILFSLLPPVTAFNVSILLHFSMAGIFTYLYMRALKVSTVAALFSGVAYMFCGFLVNWANNAGVHNSSVWLPLILFLLEKAKNEKKFIYVVSASVSCAILIFAGHPQVVVYTLMVMLFYTFYLTVFAEKDRITIFSYGIFIFVFGVLLGLIQLLPTAELADSSIRSTVTPDNPFVSYTSFKLIYAVTFVFPYFFGSPDPGFYPQAYSLKFLFKGIGYMGVLPLIFALTALLKSKACGHIAKFWALIFCGTFILLMGNNTPIFPVFCHIPFFNSFYNISTPMFVFDFAIVVLSGLGLEYVLTARKKTIKKRYIRFFVIGLLPAVLIECLLLERFLSGQAGHPSRERLIDMTTVNNPAIYIPVFFMVVSWVIYHFLSRRPDNRTLHFFIIIILFFDLFFFGHFLHQHSINVAEFIHEEKYPPIVKFLKETESDPDKYRVFPVLSNLAELTGSDFIFSNMNILYPISSIAGYDPLYLKDHLKFLNANKNGTFQKPLDLVWSNKILSLLNVKYLVAKPEQATEIESIKAITSHDNSYARTEFSRYLQAQADNKSSGPLYERVFNSPSGTIIYKNLNVLPRTYLVAKIRPVKNFDEAYRILWDQKDQFDPGLEALVEMNASELPADLAAGSATIVNYSANKVIIKTQSNGRSFLVLSDTYYPGWKAFIDGKETALYKANGIVRGVFMEPGRHIVKFVYSPLSFKIGALTCFSAFIILILISVIIKINFREGNKWPR